MNFEHVLEGFYKEEPEKFKYPDAYLEEKCCEKKRDEIFVKWLGLNSGYNNWVYKSNIG